MSAKPSKKFPWGIYLIALFVILAVALAPVGSVVVVQLGGEYARLQSG